MSELQEKVTKLSADVEAKLGEMQGRVDAAPPGAKVRATKERLQSRGGALRATVEELRKHVAGVDAQIDTHVEQATQSLTALADAGSKSALAAKAQLENSIARAQASLDAIGPQVAALKERVLWTIDAVQGETARLRDRSTELIDMLTSTRDRVLAVLAAIPAEMLPKPLVASTKTAIDNAGSHGSQQLEQVATRAAGQLDRLQEQLAAQIDRVSQAGSGQVSTARGGMTTQIQTIVAAATQASTQLAEQAERAIGSAMEQADGLKALALAQIDKLREAAAKHVLGVAAGVTQELADAGADVDASLGGAADGEGADAGALEPS